MRGGVLAATNWGGNRSPSYVERRKDPRARLGYVGYFNIQATSAEAMGMFLDELGAAVGGASKFEMMQAGVNSYWGGFWYSSGQFYLNSIDEAAVKTLMEKYSEITWSLLGGKT